MTHADQDDALEVLHQTRTTLNIDDEALLVIRKYAEEREIWLGRAASDLDVVLGRA